MVRNAYDTMLEHLYSNTLESFKTSLEQLLNGGEGFVASARTCAQSCFLQFDEGCEGILTPTSKKIWFCDIIQLFWIELDS